MWPIVSGGGLEDDKLNTVKLFDATLKAGTLGPLMDGHCWTHGSLCLRLMHYALRVVFELI